MSRTDKQCIELCLDGHREAFGQLVERYQAVLLSYLRARLGDAEMAEEAAQETFVRSYFGLRKLHKPESFYSWLLGIASRVAREQIRAERQQAEAANSLRTRATGQVLLHDADLEQAIAALTEPCREVILLHYFGGLTCAEVAKRLGIQLGAVTMRLSRAYSMLRESLSRFRSRHQRSAVEP